MSDVSSVALMFACLSYSLCGAMLNREWKNGEQWLWCCYVLLRGLLLSGIILNVVQALKGEVV